MKQSTLYKLLGYAVWLLILFFAAGVMKSDSSRTSLAFYLLGGSMMYWGVILWLFGRKHRDDRFEQEEYEQERKQLPKPRRPRGQG
ncbi:MAG: hypothetical protein K6B12_00520 [Clostridiales bacterium]|nr:hypothetical protein [Clostridiales bacterium]